MMKLTKMQIKEIAREVVKELDKGTNIKLTKSDIKFLKELKNIDDKSSTISDVVTDKKGRTIRFKNERPMKLARDS